jgi:hypothetical protein
MSDAVDKLPKYSMKAFICPFCNAYSRQVWHPFIINGNYTAMSGSVVDKFELSTCKCENCQNSTIWRDKLMIYPLDYGLPPPNPYMPEEIKEIYTEASMIYRSSNRASLALLRLAIDKLTLLLIDKGKDLNDRIGLLVKEKIIDNQVQMELDTLRVTGNNAVHPGEIDIKDKYINSEILFEILNHIITMKIEKPAKFKEKYENWLTDKEKENIDRRDKK